ncbi:MAG: acetyl-CoA hydrolase/transferase C-terminal domain-containing protein [Syntrophobacteraceae bacterium]|jgi:4-hydroxybutyrate CoA-transferase
MSMIPQEIASLVEEGCLRDKVSCNVTSARSAAFYDWLRMNPDVEVRAMDYTHNILLLFRQHRFTAIGSAICTDLPGQAVSKALGYQQITGAGGALDFARACGMGNGGSIIALTSTDGTEEHSKIVPFLKRGDVLNITRYNVDYVVTEFGVAELRGTA